MGAVPLRSESPAPAQSAREAGDKPEPADFPAPSSQPLSLLPASLHTPQARRPPQETPPPSSRSARKHACSSFDCPSMRFVPYLPPTRTSLHRRKPKSQANLYG